MGGRLKQSPLDSQFDHKLGDLDSRSADQGLVGANLDSGERLRRSQLNKCKASKMIEEQEGDDTRWR